MPDTAQHSFETGPPPPCLMPQETWWSNGRPAGGTLTICVPCYHDDAGALIAALGSMAEASEVDVLLYDDGSADERMTGRIRDGLASLPGHGALITAAGNGGRAHARNRLIAAARTDWILFLDADMRPDDAGFLARYIEAARQCEGPALIAGGFSLKHVTPTASTALHAAQSRRSECVDAATRRTAPGRYVFTSNILIHRTVLDNVGFDEGFTGWGWEDVDWGLRVAERYPVIHIDNTATHLGLDTAPVLLDKFGGSGANFARMAARHPQAAEAMPLYRMARLARRLPLRSACRRLARAGAASSLLPLGLRLALLKSYRAIAYSEDL